jgi:hypothetical protein
MVAVSELVFGLDAGLVRLGCKASTMAWYRGCWRHLQRFFASRLPGRAAAGPRRSR